MQKAAMASQSQSQTQTLTVAQTVTPQNVITAISQAATTVETLSTGTNLATSNKAYYARP
jgi:hypothetical protein